MFFLTTRPVLGVLAPPSSEEEPLQSWVSCAPSLAGESEGTAATQDTGTLGHRASDHVLNSKGRNDQESASDRRLRALASSHLGTGRRS
jgi:hypothetical protein